MRKTVLFPFSFILMIIRHCFCLCFFFPPPSGRFSCEYECGEMYIDLFVIVRVSPDIWWPDKLAFFCCQFLRSYGQFVLVHVNMHMKKSVSFHLLSLGSNRISDGRINWYFFVNFFAPMDNLSLSM